MVKSELDQQELYCLCVWYCSPHNFNIYDIFYFYYYFLTLTQGYVC